mgnify:CR=1 FL=1|tara:strand:- start:3027 stop:3239 length:213 start_codon:yes stop_codon:yes gene_type:complete
MRDGLTLYPTLGIMAALLLAVIYLLWKEKQPSEPGKVRLMPTTPLMFLAILGIVLMAAHLLTLSGMHTGR